MQTQPNLSPSEQKSVFDKSHRSLMCISKLEKHLLQGMVGKERKGKRNLSNLVLHKAQGSSENQQKCPNGVGNNTQNHQREGVEKTILSRTLRLYYVSLSFGCSNINMHNVTYAKDEKVDETVWNKLHGTSNLAYHAAMKNGGHEK